MRYEQLKEILISAFAERDLNKGSIIEAIKEKLKKADLCTYQAWEKEYFKISHGCDATTQDDDKFTRTLSRSVPANIYISIYDALRKKEARINASNISINSSFDYSQCQLEFANTLKGAINEISQNPDKVIPNTLQCTLLYIAIKENRLDIVTCLVDEIKVDITSPVILRRIFKTALDCANYYDHLDVVKYLIERKNVDFTNCTSDGLSPVHCAAISGGLDVANYLDEKKGNFTTISNKGNSPLDLAVMEGHLEAVKYLVKAKNVICHFYGMPLMPWNQANFQNSNIELKNSLINKGVNINTRNNEGVTLVMAAAFYGNLSVLRYVIVKMHGDIYVRDKVGRTILHCAAASGNFDMVKYLMEKKGVEQYINIRRSDNNWTTLYQAVYKGHYEITEFLISKGATLTSCDKDMNTPLHIAVANGHDTVVELLVRSGAELNTRNKSGYTPLHFAVEEGHLKIVNFLIEKGANINMEDEKGNTPLDLIMYTFIKNMVAACYTTVN